MSLFIGFLSACYLLFFSSISREMSFGFGTGMFLVAGVGRPNVVFQLKMICSRRETWICNCPSVFSFLSDSQTPEYTVSFSQKLNSEMWSLGTLVQIFILLEHPDWIWSLGCGWFGSISHTKCAWASKASGSESSISRKHPASWTCAWQSSAHGKPWKCCMPASPGVVCGAHPSAQEFLLSLNPVPMCGIHPSAQGLLVLSVVSQNWHYGEP